MATTYTITNSTSVLLINSYIPNTVVLLSSISYPGHVVGIRDTTGSLNLRTNPITVSTTAGLKFYDGTSSILINNPYDYLTVSSKDSNTWQLINTVGYQKFLSNAYLSTLTSYYVYAQITSTQTEYVSTINTNNIIVTNSIDFQGLTNINGSTIFQSSLSILSTLYVNGNLNISTSLQVWGSTIIQSSLTVQSNTIFNNNVSSFGLQGNNIFVSSVASLINANLPKFLSTQVIGANQLTIGGPVVVTGNISTSELTVSTGISFTNGLMTNYISTGNNAYIKDILYIGGNIYTSSIIGNKLLTNNLFISGNMTIVNNISTFGTLVASSIYSYNTQIQSTINVLSLTSVNNLFVTGGIGIASTLNVVSTTSIASTLNTNIDGLLTLNNVFVSGPTIIGNNTMINLLTATQLISTNANLNVKMNIVIQSTLSSQKTLIGGNLWLTSTASIADNISSFNFNTNGSVNVGGTINITGYINTDTITIRTQSNYIISTLNVKLLTATTTIIPIIILSTTGNQSVVNQLGNNQSIGKIIAGIPNSLNYQGQDLFVYGVAKIGSSFIQTQTQQGIQFYSRNLNTSTFIIEQKLSSLMVGSTILQQQYNTFNVTSLFRQNVSTNIINIGSHAGINSSTFLGSFVGDGSGLTNLTNITSNLIASTATISTINAYFSFAQEIKTQQMFVETQTVSTSIFLSTQYNFIAVGFANNQNNYIQTSVDGINWTPNQNTVFSQYGTSVITSGNSINQFYLATGADSTNNKTLQWTTDGNTWIPATSGGFTYTTNLSYPSVTYSIGYDITYNSVNGTWVALGADMGGTSNTIKYSTDGKNWITATNGFKYGINPLIENQALTSNDGTYFITIGTDDLTNYYIKYSTDGINWLNTSVGGIQPATNISVGYGYFNNGGVNYTGFGWRIKYLFNSIYTLIVTNNFVTVLYYNSPVSVYMTSKLIYNGSYWLGILKNTASVYLVFTGYDLGTYINTTGRSNLTLDWNSNQQLWYIGTVDSTQVNTLLRSSDGITWTPATSGGFTQGVTQFGTGYGIAYSPNLIGVVGTSVNSNINTLKPGIINYNSVTNIGGVSTLLNVFDTKINAIAYKSTEDYPWVAVGDGQNSLKTIGRSVNFSTPSSWLPATTGGFTVGNGVIYSPFSNVWVAVGQGSSQLNTIQYSADGANWFGTNNCVNLNSGYIGYGITTGVITPNNFYWVVGYDTTRANTILYNNTGVLNNWLSAASGGFSVRGTAITVGTGGTQYIIATGVDSVRAKTIQVTTDGINWSQVTGGFSIGGYGIAYNSANIFVAVGEDAIANNSIQYTTDGLNWTSATSGGFTKAGYSVIWNATNSIWIATGQDINGQSNATIKYSSDGLIWTNITTGGFDSLLTVGAANGITSQSLLYSENQPNLQTSNLIIYNRSSNITYTNNTLRLQSNYMSFNEMLSISLSSKQVSIGINTTTFNQTEASLITNRVYASSIIFYGEINLNSTISISTIIASTVTSYQYNSYNYIKTSTLGIGLDVYNNTLQTQANYIKIIPSTISLNSNIFIKTVGVGIGTSSPTTLLDIIGTVASSTIITSNISSYSIQGNILNNQYLNILTKSIPITTNNILLTPSSITFNNILTINISSQNIGYNTINPIFNLDVRSLAVISSISSQQITVGSLYLSPQYI